MKTIKPEQLIDALPEESWLRTWMDIWPTVEAPSSYLLFSALATLSGAYGRKVWLDQDYRKTWPMLNLLLIGPSGIGKTTSLLLALGLLERRVGNGLPQIIAGKASPEKLHFDLSNNPHAVVFAEELAASFGKQKYMEASIPYVTKLLNYLPYVEERTKTGDVVRVDEPAVTIMGGSTVEWLQEQLPDSAMAGGFLPRFLIVYEQHKRQRVPLPSRALGRSAKAELEKARDRVDAEFENLLHFYEGPMDFKDYAVADVYELWANSHKPLAGHLEPFAARAGEYVQRLSMLVALTCRRAVILEEDVEAAIVLYEYSEQHLQEVVVPYTPQGQLLQLVLDTVGTDSLSQVTLYKAMRHHLSVPEIDKLVESLLISKDLVQLPNGALRRAHV